MSCNIPWHLKRESRKKEAGFGRSTASLAEKARLSATVTVGDTLASHGWARGGREGLAARWRDREVVHAMLCSLAGLKRGVSFMHRRGRINAKHR